jgi:1-acyl-sn-glycerol-3-phosphate acyltransferase
MEKLKKIWIMLVKLLGWKLNLPEEGSRPEFERCVFVMAPHTSALDFIIGAAYLWACCSNGRVFIAKEFFFWPLGPFLRGLGCISIDRRKDKSKLVTKSVVVSKAVDEFSKNRPLSIVITPEATRKPTKKWSRGFWEIANEAGVPIVPTYVNFKTKQIGTFDTIYPSDCQADLLRVRKLYKKDMAKYPEKFIELEEIEVPRNP